MTSPEKLALLKLWAAQVSKYEILGDQLSSLFGTLADMPLYEGVTDLLKAYTDSVAILVQDTGTWLDWHLWENAMGKSGLDVTFNTGTVISVKTLEDLLLVIETSATEEKFNA